MWQDIVYYVLLTIESLVGIFGIRLYEETPYVVLETPSIRLEIRSYAPRLAAEIELPSASEAGRNEAFRALFAYIAGANLASHQGRKTISMTVPVELRQAARVPMSVPVQTAEQKGNVRMLFFLPQRLTPETIPVPIDSRVRVVALKETIIATLRFSGPGRDIASRKIELLAKLEGTRWQPVGEPYALFYNAPFTLPFLRRNETAVSVASR